MVVSRIRSVEMTEMMVRIPSSVPTGIIWIVIVSVHASVVPWVVESPIAAAVPWVIPAVIVMPAAVSPWTV